MAEQELTSLKITLSSDIKQGDINKANKLADVFDRLDKIKVNNQLPSYLQKMATAMQGFKGVTIGASFNKSITNLTETLNNITSIKDITPYAENLKTGFRALSEATSGFNGADIKIPVGLGKGITGIIEATNKITEVKDINQHANTLVRNFNIISQATRSFDGMKGADYTGISRLIAAMTSINKIKPINNTVVDNAKKLAEAINTLDKDTNVSTLRLHQLSGAAKAIGVSFNSSTNSVKGFGGSLKLVNFALVIQGMRKMINLAKKLVIELLSFVKAYGQVQNTMSFFTNSMGDQAVGAAHLIQQYADFGAIDFTEFSDQTAKLNQMYKNYGISAENSAKMALNMTQLAYDLSYAMGENGEDIALWNQRMTSISTGNVRAGYWAGLDLSVKALAEDFEGLTSKTEKGIKIQAAYNAILEQTKDIQGQLPKEFQNSYVQMQVFQNKLVQLKQSIGQALVPAFQTIIQWGLVALKVVERVIGAIARLFGTDFKLIDYGQMIEDMGSGGMSGVADSTQAVADGMSDATNNAKELKKTISGIDQVFTINDEKPSTSGSGGSGAGGVGGVGGAVSGYDWLDDLATDENIDALKKVDEAADKIIGKIEKIIPLAITIGGLFAAWKVLNLITSLSQAIGKMNDVSSILGNLGTIVIGVGLALVGFEIFKSGLKKLMEGDVTWTSIGMTVGGAIIAGIGVAMIAKGGVGLLASAFPASSLATWASTTGSSIGGFIKVGIGLGLVAGGLALVFTGFKDAFENGYDWKNIGMIVGGAILAGIGVAFTISSVKKILDGANAGTPIAESISGTLLGSETTVSKASDGASKLTGKLKDLATNLFWGGVIIAEVVIIGAIFVGGIALIGLLLQQVIKAWEPVLADGDTALIAIGLGTGILVAIGGVSYLLGKSGTETLTNIALGSATLLLIEMSALIFVSSISLIGTQLEKLGKAWKPVLDNGSTIKSGIALGTTLLVGVGLASFLLGTATVASAGSIPVAIGIGTAMLVLLTGATVLFIQEMKLIADQLANQLAPSLARLNEIMPELSENMKMYTFFMLEFAGHVIAQTATNAISGLAGTIDTIIGWFTKDPIKKMGEDVDKNITQFNSLNDALSIANPLLVKGNDGMVIYMDLLALLYSNAKKASSLGTMPSIGVQFKEFSKALKDGFADLDKTKTSNVASIMQALNSIDLSKFRGIGTSIVRAMELGINNYVFGFTTTTNKIKNGLTFNASSIGSGIANTLASGINSSYVNVNTFTNKIKSALNVNSRATGSSIATSVVSGINSGSVNVATFTNRIKSNLNVSTYQIGRDIAWGVQTGINSFYPNLTTFTDRLKKGMRVSFEVRSPSRWARDVIGAMIGKGVEIGVNNTEVNLNPFKRNISEGMYDIIDSLDVQPAISTPSFDTSKLNGDIKGATQALNTQVLSKLDVTNDGTERAIAHLTDATVELLTEVVDAVKQGKDIVLDGEKISKTVSRSMRNAEINNNTVF